MKRGRAPESSPRRENKNARRDGDRDRRPPPGRFGAEKQFSQTENKFEKAYEKKYQNKNSNSSNASFRPRGNHNNNNKEELKERERSYQKVETTRHFQPLVENTGGRREKDEQENNNNKTSNDVFVLKKHREFASREVVVILENADLCLGPEGYLLDDYPELKKKFSSNHHTTTTSIGVAGVREEGQGEAGENNHNNNNSDSRKNKKIFKPEIVHQCLLALYDSELAYQQRLRVYININSLAVSSQQKNAYKVIELSPSLRPPRTYYRFKGLFSYLLKNGVVQSKEGKMIMRTLPGSIAPLLPQGAEVIGITNINLNNNFNNNNNTSTKVITPLKLALQHEQHPVPDSLLGGLKNICAFYVVSCQEQENTEKNLLQENTQNVVDYVTQSVSLNVYPLSAPVQCARLGEAHALC